MVYNVFNVHHKLKVIKLRNIRKFKPSKLPKFKNGYRSISVSLLIIIIRLLLFVYDYISLPIYFVFQESLKRAKIESFSSSAYLAKDAKSSKNESHYLTLDKMFSKAVREFDSKSCLGYRAVVTCPVLVSNDEGEHVIQDTSFRSDYTWYTYGQIGIRVQDIASGLQYYLNVSQPCEQAMKALFLASTSLEWFCLAQACFQLSIQLVLAPEIDQLEALLSIIRETKVEIIFVSCDRLKNLCELLLATRFAFGNRNDCTIKKLIITDWQFHIDMDEDSFGQLKQATSHLSELQVLSIGQLEEAGAENPIILSCTKALSEINLNQIIEPTKNHKGSHLTSRVQASLSFRLARPRYGCHNGEFRSRRLSYDISLIQQFSRNLKRSTSKTIDQSNLINGGHILFESMPHDLALVVYTYGSSGQLKPIMMTHDQMVNCSNQLHINGFLSSDDIHCTIIPLDHMIELATELRLFSIGASIGYSCNTKTLFYDGCDLFENDKSDLDALNPTFLLIKPHILDQLCRSIQRFQDDFANQILSFSMRNILFQYKKYWSERHFSTPIVDRLFFERLRRLFGRNIKYILSDGPICCSETKEFFAYMLNMPIIEIYGPVEAILSMVTPDITSKIPIHVESLNLELCRSRAIKFDASKSDLMKNFPSTLSHLIPAHGTRVRLEDWKEFRSTDKPYPRGRLIISGKTVCDGYLNRQEGTKQAFHIDSNHIRWFRTSDIARAHPNGTFEIISDMKDIMKTKNDQLISLSQFEHILRNSKYVDNVCSLLVADGGIVINIVAPDLRRLALRSPGEANLKMAIDLDLEPDELSDIEFRREVCNDRFVSEFVGYHLNDLLTRNGLITVPNRFLLVSEIWTPESGLVDHSFKPKRAIMQKFYADDIRSLLELQETSFFSCRLSSIRHGLTKGSLKLRSKD